MRTTPLVTGEYYHVLGRGNNKQPIVRDNRDRARLLFTFLHFQADVDVRPITPKITLFTKRGTFGVSQKKIDAIVDQRYVELVNFAIMNNHYHLTLYQSQDDGISHYMQRCLNSYTKSFNTRYEQNGHLFQGPFKAIPVEEDSYLRYLSAYIHRNPRELKHWRGKERAYPWSSYQDYIDENRWGKLLKPDIILGGFKDAGEYNSFVRSSEAKKFDDEFEYLI